MDKKCCDDEKPYKKDTFGIKCPIFLVEIDFSCIISSFYITLISNHIGVQYPLIVLGGGGGTLTPAYWYFFLLLWLVHRHFSLIFALHSSICPLPQSNMIRALFIYLNLSVRMHIFYLHGCSRES